MTPDSRNPCASGVWEFWLVIKQSKSPPGDCDSKKDKSQGATSFEISQFRVDLLNVKCNFFSGFFGEKRGLKGGVILLQKYDSS